MRIGYERVSTENQSTLRQEDMMLSQNLDAVVVEKESGKTRDRLKPKKMLASVQKGLCLRDYFKSPNTAPDSLVRITRSFLRQHR